MCRKHFGFSKEQFWFSTFITLLLVVGNVVQLECGAELELFCPGCSLCACNWLKGKTVRFPEGHWKTDTAFRLTTRMCHVDRKCFWDQSVWAHSVAVCCFFVFFFFPSKDATSRAVKSSYVRKADLCEEVSLSCMPYGAQPLPVCVDSSLCWRYHQQSSPSEWQQEACYCRYLASCRVLNCTT